MPQPLHVVNGHGAERSAQPAGGARQHWQILTPEYPPQPGGVADYTRQIAEGLREAGDDVDVWCRSGAAESNCDPKWVHRGLRGFSGEMRSGGVRSRVLVQWVPHGFGWRSMNVFFCGWLLWRAWAVGDEIELMVHEPFLSFREGSRKQDLAACIHRLMAVILLLASKRVWLSTLAWEKKLRPFALGRRLPFRWLPVPSNIPVQLNDAGIERVREELDAGSKTIFGHFSSYSLDISAMLRSILPPLLETEQSCLVQLLGRGSEGFREEMIAAHPRWSERIVATGQLASERLSSRLAACDVVLQPYPDGVTTRRTTVMATLEHGLPVVTTVGRLSEALWANCNAVVAVPAENPSQFVRVAQTLAGNEAELARLRSAASAFYSDHFGLARVIRDLRSADQN